MLRKASDFEVVINGLLTEVNHKNTLHNYAPLGESGQ
jgi:hypothetical protein